jgi:[ribosomal protein S5]-alanine N-acetyltransferase
MDCIETSRLLLRPFKNGDGPALHKVVGDDPDMTWDRSIRPVEMVTRTARDRMIHFTTHGFGVWAVIEKSTQMMIGQTGLQRLPNTDKIELVTYTAKRLWRHGYAYEACMASLRYGFETLGAEEILAVVKKGNVAAMALMKKLGFRHLKDDFLYETNVEVSTLGHADFHWDDAQRFAIYPAPDEPKDLSNIK